MSTTQIDTLTQIDALIAEQARQAAEEADRHAAEVEDHRTRQEAHAEHYVRHVAGALPFGLGVFAKFATWQTDDRTNASATIYDPALRLAKIEIRIDRRTADPIPDFDTAERGTYTGRIEIAGNRQDWPTTPDEWIKIIANGRAAFEDAERKAAEKAAKDAAWEAERAKAQAAEQARQAKEAAEYDSLLARYKAELIDYGCVAIEADRHNKALVDAWNAEQASAFWLTEIEYGITSEGAADKRRAWSAGKDTAGYYRTLEQTEDYSRAAGSTILTYAATWRKYTHIVSETAPTQYTPATSPICSRTTISAGRGRRAYGMIAAPDAGAAFMKAEAERIAGLMQWIPDHPADPNNTGRGYWRLTEADRSAAATQAHQALAAAGYGKEEIGAWIETPAVELAEEF